MLVRSTLLGLLVSFFISCSDRSETVITPLNTNVSNVNSLAENSNSDGFVKDEQAAIEIAVKAWIQNGFRETIEQEKPYKAELEDGVWKVSGTAPKNWVGGLAYAHISEKDGRVLRAWHDK